MKSPIKPCFLLLCLVAGIYVMRNSNVSFGNAVKHSFRVLQEYRPSEQLCTGVSIEDTFSQSEIDRAQGFKNSLQGMRNGNPLKDVLTSGSMDGFASDYAIPLIPFIAPWIVLFAISVFVTIGLCCNWCCIYGCCKKAKCCKCCKAPKDANRKRIYIALSAFFLLGTFGTGIAGIVISSQVPKGMELTICSFIAMAEDLAYGVPAKQWIGATPAVVSVGDLIANIDSAISGLTPTPDSAVTDITTTYNAVKNQLDNVMEPNLNVAANKNVPRSDPSQAPNTYTSTYISQISTFVDAIDQECIAKKDAISAAQPNIRDAIQQINSQSGTIKTSLIDGQTSMNDISVSIQDFLKTLDDFGGTSKDIIKIIGTVLQAIFIVNLVLGVFGLASMVMVGILKIKFFNKFLHFNWCVLLIFTIFGWILSCIFYPLSVVMMESCDVLDSSLTSESTLNSVLGTLISGANEPDGIGDTMGYCLFSTDGDLAVKLGLAAQLENFLKIGDEFNTIPTDIPIADARPPCLTLNEQKTQAADWKIGKTADAPESAADLLALTKAVNKGYTPCTTLYDTWQFNSANCDASSYKFAATDNDNDKIGQAVCIGFDVWTTSPPGHTISNRYTSTQFPGCSTNAGLPAQTYAQNFVNNFITARAKVKTVFTNVETELGQVELKYNDFGDKLQVVLRDFAATQTALNTIEASLTGATSGIATNLKCAFIGDSMRRISDSMCVGFISGVYQSSVVIIIASVFTLFGSIFVFCLAKRFVLEGKDNKAKPI